MLFVAVVVAPTDPCLLHMLDNGTAISVVVSDTDRRWDGEFDQVDTAESVRAALRLDEIKSANGTDGMKLEVVTVADKVVGFMDIIAVGTSTGIALGQLDSQTLFGLQNPIPAPQSPALL